MFFVFNQEKRKNLKYFVNTGYWGWWTILEKEAKHNANSYHLNAMQVDTGIIQKMEHAVNTLSAFTDSSLSERYKKIIQLS